MSACPPPLRTRRPTGLPSWPMLLIAGGEKSGKSWSCAAASGSDLVGRTLWVSVGEDDPDEYGRVPGADFEIVQHDGTYRGILNTLTAATAQPAQDERPNLIILDSATRLWDLLCGMAQDEANRRAVEKAEKYHRPAPDGDVQITMDLWNTAKDRWGHLVDVLRAHQGPSIITARLEEVTVIDGRGQPTQDKTLKIKTEKSLPYDVGAIVEMPTRGKAYLCGVRSTVLQLRERTEIKGEFTVDRLWRDLGLADRQVGARTHSRIDRTVPVEEQEQPAPRRGRPDQAARPVGLNEALVRFLADAAKAPTVEAVAALRARLDHERLNADATAALNPEARGVTDVAGLTPEGQPVTVGHWLDACEDFLGREGGMTVAAAVAAERETQGRSEAGRAAA